MAHPNHWQSRAAFYAQKYGIDPNIFTRQIRQESNFRPNAVSHAGAIGIAQIVPRWHPNVNPRDPEASLNYAARWMSQLHKQYGNYRDALAVYNSGRPWAKSKSFRETNNYVNTILGGVDVAPKAKGGGAHSDTPNVGSSDMMGGLFSQQDFKALVASQLLQASSQGGQMSPGSLLGLAGARQRLSQAESMFGSTGNSRGAYPALDAVVSGSQRGGVQDMLSAIRKARAMGLSVRENPFVDKVDPVHTKNSFHYRTFAGSKVGRGADISGDPRLMAQFYNWARQRYPYVAELFYDPLGGIKYGKQIGAIGGHKNHVHIAF